MGLPQSVIYLPLFSPLITCKKKSHLENSRSIKFPCNRKLKSAERYRIMDQNSKRSGNDGETTDKKRFHSIKRSLQHSETNNKLHKCWKGNNFRNLVAPENHSLIYGRSEAEYESQR